MLLSELLSKIEYSGTFTERDIDDITNDSRRAHAGAVFVCIRGFATDGHLFALGAYAAGCRTFICERKIYELPHDADCIIVKNSRAALSKLSSKLRGEPSGELYVIGITGTKGKTTCALMIKKLLDGAGIPTGYIGSNGIQYGGLKIESANTTPESHIIQYYMRKMADAGIKVLAMEISSQALSMGRVSDVGIDAAIFTNFSPDHIGPHEHASLEEYFLAKKKLFDEYGVKTVFANADDECTDRMLTDCPANIITFSTESGADYTASSIRRYRDSSAIGVSFDCRAQDGTSRMRLAFPGRFNVHNALCAIAVARHLGVEWDKISALLEKISIDGRFESITSESGACFVIDYAHNGMSLSACLEALREYEPDRLICLFGSVGCRTQVRRIQMGRAASALADFSILTSDNPDTEDPMQIIGEIASQFESPSSYVAIADRESAIRYAVDMARSGDIILLAGKGHERYQIIRGSHVYFCEREIIEDELAKQALTKG